MHIDVEPLAVKAATGDSRALDQLLGAINADVLARCSRALPNRHDAEEASQDALLAIARSISSFAGRSKFSTWAYRIVSNRIIDTYRRLKRQRVSAAEIPDLPDDQRTSVIAGTQVDLLEAMEQTEDRLVEPVAMRDLCGLSYTEIAAELDLPIGTVKSRISEGRKRIGALMV